MDDCAVLAGRWLDLDPACLVRLPAGPTWDLGPGRIRRALGCGPVGRHPL